MSYCECGCGQTTRICRSTDPRKGAVRGQPRRFVLGHHRRKSFGVHYAKRSAGGTNVLLHRLRAERALGHPLPVGAIVHHADGSRDDGAPLVICQDERYHKLLHARMRLKKAGGDPDRDAICAICDEVKPRTEFYPRPISVLGVESRCKPCTRAAQFVFRQNRKSHLHDTDQVSDTEAPTHA